MYFVRWMGLQNAEAPVVISSEMCVHQPTNTNNEIDDPRQARIFKTRVLHPQSHFVQDRRVILCHSTKNSRMIIACGMDHDIETECSHTHNSKCSEDFGQAVFTIEAQPGSPIHLTKYISYHVTLTASKEEISQRCERTPRNHDRHRKWVSWHARVF